MDGTGSPIASGFRQVGEVARPLVRAGFQARQRVLRAWRDQAAARGDFEAAEQLPRRLLEHEIAYWRMGDIRGGGNGGRGTRRKKNPTAVERAIEARRKAE